MSSFNVSEVLERFLPLQNFSTRLHLGISYFAYLNLILSTERFSHVSVDVDRTARITSLEYTEDSNFSCYCPSPFNPRVYWFHGYIFNNSAKVEEIFPLDDDEYSIQNERNSHKLIIHRARIDKSGSYTCLYEERDRYRDFTSRINLKKLPQFDFVNQRLYGSENESVVINCQVLGGEDLDYEVIWTRHGNILVESEKYSMWIDNFNNYLNISHLTEEDKGWYYCKIKDSIDRKKKFVLYIRSLEVPNDAPEVRIMHAGEDLNISCPSNLIGNIELRKSIGMNMPLILVSSVITINGPIIFSLKHLMTKDEGLYVCVATGQNNKIFPQMFLRVLEYKPQLLERTEFLILYYGSQAQIKCESTFRSFQGIIWLENSTQNILAHGDKLFHLHNNRLTLHTDEYSSTLVIKSVRFTDENHFICRLGHLRAQLFLMVRDVPQIHFCTFFEKIPTGFESIIFCTHEPSSDKRITWFFKGSKLNLTSNKFHLENDEHFSKLVLRDPQIRDTGMYTACFVDYKDNCLDYEFRTLSFFQEVDFVLSEKNTELSYDTKIEFLPEGDSVNMVCQIKNLYNRKKICWVRPDGYIMPCNSGIYVDEEYTISSRDLFCNMTIINLIGDSAKMNQKTHSGAYTCQISCTNETKGFDIITTYHLSVKSGPKFVYATKNYTAFFGYEYRLNCDVLNADGREIIIMKKTESDFKVVKSEIMPLRKEYKFEYVISFAKESHSGEYIFQFRPSTWNDQELSEMVAYLNVISAPIITTIVTGEVSVGSAVDLYCDVLNMENYAEDWAIEWWRENSDGFQLLSSGNSYLRNRYYYELKQGHHSSHLIIKHLFNSDGGFYVCVITAYPMFNKLLALNFEKLRIEEEDKLIGIRGVPFQISCKLPRIYTELFWYLKWEDNFYSIEDANAFAEHHDLPLQYSITNDGDTSRLNITTYSSEIYVYRCLFKNLYIVDRTVEIGVPYISTSASGELETGKSVTLTCNISNADNFAHDYVIEWWKIGINKSQIISNGNSLILSQYYYQLRHRDRHSQLTIRHLFSRDIGLYECRVKSFAKSFFLEFATLTILRKKKEFRISGRNAELRCKFQFNNKNISWFVRSQNFFYAIKFLESHEQKLQWPRSFEIVNDDEFSKLIINNATPSHSSVFRCLYPGAKIIDQALEIIDSKIMKVNDVDVEYGLTASLICKIKYNDEVEAKWFRNGVHITGREPRHTLVSVSSSSQYSLTLVISSVGTEDQGIYKCLMMRSNQQLHKSANLTVHTKMTPI